MTRENLLRAFLDRNARDVFASVEGPNQIWEPDPYDVPSIHDEARAAFERAFAQVLGATPADPGRQLLLLGDSGCGKTHLLRAFRASVQEPGRGYFAYLHLRTGVRDYRRYLLHHLVDSLTRRYNQQREESALQHLSDAIAAFCGPTLDYLREPEGRTEELVRECVVFVVDELMKDPPFADLDQQLLRALLLLQARDDGRYARAVSSWLRCEELPRMDLDLLGVVTPRTRDDDPMRTVRALGAAIGATDAALVIAVDQVEDSYDPSIPESVGQIRPVVEALREASERTPHALVVLSCLNDFWTAQRQKLTQSLLDRIERNPAPAHLENIRSAEEAADLISTRLEALYDGFGLQPDPAAPIHPFPRDRLRLLSGKRTRDVIHACHSWREQALRAGKLPDRFPLETDAIGATTVGLERLDELWSDAQASWAAAPPSEEGALLELLRTTCSHLAAEGFQFLHKEEEGRLAVTGGPGPLLVAICNRGTKGGALLHQLSSLAAAAGARKAVAFRSTSFGKGVQTMAELAAIKRRGGWTHLIEDVEARVLMAFGDFHATHRADADYAEWRRSRKPLGSLRLVREGLQLLPAGGPPVRRELEPEPPSATRPPAISPPPSPPRPPPGSELALGATLGLRPAPIDLGLSALTQHAAFIGGTGSGKTTLALSVVEQLLTRGVSAVLVDRKGDLAGYARAQVDPGLAELRRQFEVALYTPGELRGRALRIPLVPLLAKGSSDTAELALVAASAIASMLQYPAARAGQMQVILAQAIEALIELGTPRFDLQELISFIDSEDDALVSRLERLDTTLLKRLVTDLEVLRLTSKPLFAPEAEALDVEALLAPTGGRPRLTIVSTKFLGDTRRTLFFMAQFISAIGRWCGQHPRKELGAVVMLDEADLYLPAVRTPPTKQPLENLLRRGRSAGVGLLLATQNPGDFDYNCRDNVRTWFIGRVREENSIRKLRAVLSDKGAAALDGKIAEQATGQFVLAGGGPPRQFLARPSAMKTDQVPDEEILALAAAARPQGPR